MGILGCVRHACHCDRMTSGVKPSVHRGALSESTNPLVETARDELFTRWRGADDCHRADWVVGPLPTRAPGFDRARNPRHGSLRRAASSDLEELDGPGIPTTGRSAIRTDTRTHPPRGGCFLGGLARCHLAATRSSELSLGVPDRWDGLLTRCGTRTETTRDGPEFRHTASTIPGLERGQSQRESGASQLKADLPNIRI
jgi:hypothetical protein